MSAPTRPLGSRLGALWFLDWRKLLVYTHRWLGIAGCVLFIGWFISGIVMMYARMPGLANEERLGRSQVLDLTTATLSPREAAEQAGVRGDQFSVGMLRGRPVYRFGGNRSPTTVFADNGEIFDGMGVDEALLVARQYAPRHKRPIRYDGYVTTPDQWTLQARQSMPMHRFALDDDEATYLYISEVSGNVVLRTTRRERFWGYLGPVIHWVYFTPLRQNGPLWTQFVIWSSLIGCVMCSAGLLWGLWRFSPFGRFRLRRTRSKTPYSGWMMWHHYAGLLFGVVTLTWTYSGLLSMGPFNWFRAPAGTRVERDAATGGRVRLDQLTLDSMRQAVRTLEASFQPKELEVMQFKGEPFWLASRAPSADEADRWIHYGLIPRAPLPRLEQRYVAALRPDQTSFSRFPDDAMAEIARAAMPAVPIKDAVWLHDYDGYYYDSRGTKALPVLRIRYDDAYQTWIYLDPARGGIVQRSVSITRLRRWLYQGLHSLDFPFLYYQRPLWDIVVIALSLGGTVLSITTLLPAWRRLNRRGRELSARVRRRWQTVAPTPGVGAAASLSRGAARREG